MKRLYNASFFYLVLGLLLGLFGREFTKLNDFKGDTMLDIMHTHVLILGFIFFLIAFICAKSFQFHQVKGYTSWFIVYNSGLIITATAMMIRGFLQVNGTDMAGISHIAGLGHIIITVGFIWFMILLGKKTK